MKPKATTKVALNINFSSPLLVKEELPPKLLLLPKPVPLAWTNIRPIKAMEKIICKTINTSFIAVSITQAGYSDKLALFKNPINNRGNEGN